MTNKAKIRLLNISGAVISFAAPAVAAVLEFPRVKSEVTVSNDFLTVLNLSTAAFAIIAILLAVSCWRFIKNHITLPDSGLGLTLVLLAICYGVELIIHSFVVILEWAALGCLASLILYKFADKLEGKDG